MVPEALEPWFQLSSRERWKKKLMVWLVNRHEGMLIQLKADTTMRHAWYILVSDHSLSARFGKLIRQKQILST